MGQSKRKKAAPPPQRPDQRFREVPAEVLRGHLVKLRETMGEGEMYDDFRMLVETMLLLRDEAGQKGVSIQRLQFILHGPKTESFAAVCKEAIRLEREAGKPKEPREKPKGHGRNGAADYPKAKRIPVSLPGAASGESCPHCPNGKVYPLKEPSPLLRITGVLQRSPEIALGCSPKVDHLNL